MPLHLDEFQRDQLQGYIENVPPQREYLLRSVMPEETTSDINFAFNVINGRYSTSASITGWNASAPFVIKRKLKRHLLKLLRCNMVCDWMKRNYKHLTVHVQIKSVRKLLSMFIQLLMNYHKALTTSRSTCVHKPFIQAG